MPDSGHLQLGAGGDHAAFIVNVGGQSTSVEIRVAIMQSTQVESFPFLRHSAVSACQFRRQSS